PARYHAFARALEGVFACLNQQDHEDLLPHLFLSRHETCPDCGSRVVELATCVRCGATYVVGRKESNAVQENLPTRKQYTLRQLAANITESADRSAYFLLNEQTGYVDEDEITITGDEPAEQSEVGELYRLCLHCGILSPREGQLCTCGGSAIVLREM